MPAIAPAARSHRGSPVRCSKKKALLMRGFFMERKNLSRDATAVGVRS